MRSCRSTSSRDRVTGAVWHSRSAAMSTSMVARVVHKQVVGDFDLLFGRPKAVGQPEQGPTTLAEGEHLRG